MALSDLSGLALAEIDELANAGEEPMLLSLQVALDGEEDRPAGEVLDRLVVILAEFGVFVAVDILESTGVVSAEFVPMHHEVGLVHFFPLSLFRNFSFQPSLRFFSGRS